MFDISNDVLQFFPLVGHIPACYRSFFVILRGEVCIEVRYFGGIKMMYLLAVVLPPAAVLFSGKPVQAILNLILTLFFWLPGAIHAILVVKDVKDDKRMQQYIQATKK